MGTINRQLFKVWLRWLQTGWDNPSLFDIPRFVAAEAMKQWELTLLGWGGGGVLRISSEGMLKWEQRSKPKKIPGPKIKPPKIPCHPESIK